MSRPPVQAAAGGVRIALRVTPKASRTAVVGLADTADGGQVVKLTVTAAPEDGKANQAVIKLLAREWGMAKSALTLVSGQTDRNKILQVTGDAAALLAHLTAWTAGLPGGRETEDQT